MKDIFEHINSVCPTCRSKGQIVAENGNINICPDCEGKGYKTVREIYNEIKKLGKTPRQEKKKK